MKKLLLSIVFLMCVFTIHAAYLRNVPTTIVQPDSTEVHCFITGDEFYGWLHDSSGYTLIQDPRTGFVMYATLQNDELVSSGYRVGSIDPASIELQPWTIISTKKREKLRNDFINSTLPRNLPNNNMAVQATNNGVANAINNTGIINNLVIFIDFPSDTFSSAAITNYMQRFDNGQANGISTMRHYFYSVSGRQIDIRSNTHHLYRDTHSRSYYLSNVSGGYNPATPSNLSATDNRAGREYQLLTAAINSANAGSFDHVCFVIKGSHDPNITNRILWPHQWNIIGRDYNLIPETELNVGTMSHEMFHSIGAPDLYRYKNTSIDPVGYWDLMSYQTDPPQHMTAYMKWKYGGWLTIPEITKNDTVLLSPNQARIIASPNSAQEYFIVEYRQQSNWDWYLLSGLIIYRVNKNPTKYGDGSSAGNAEGPPDEVYVFRPNASNNATNGNINNAHFSSPGRTIFKDTTSNPPCFLSNDLAGGIHIKDIGVAGGATMRFVVEMNNYDPIIATSVIGSGTVTITSILPPQSHVLQVPTTAGRIDSNIRAQRGSTVTCQIQPPDNFTRIDYVEVDGNKLSGIPTTPGTPYSFTLSNNINEHHIIVVCMGCPTQPTPAQASYINQTDCMLLEECWKNQAGANSPSNSPWTVWAIGGPGPLIGPGMFAFYSRSYPAGSSAQLISPKIITNSNDYTASFWMYRDNSGTYGGQNYQDKINVYFNTSPTTTGLSPAYTVHRCKDIAPIESADGWYYYSISVPTIYTNGTYVIFEAVGDNGNNIYVDEFYIDETVSTLKVKPTISNYNAIAVGTTSTPQVVTVSGIMTDNFTYTKTGANANDFTITETFWDTNRGGILSVTFTPSGIGARTAEIIISSDSDLMQIVTLNGIGLDTAKFYCTGTGTAIDPYQICNASQLAAFAVHVNTGNSTIGKYFILVNDIDLSSFSAGAGWQQIGNVHYDFQGNFNGNGKVIRNLIINRPTENFVGLFGAVNGATIQNLGIENAHVNGKSYVGALVGDAYGGSTINNCYAIGVVGGNEDYVGGLVGYNYNSSTVTNSYVSCNVSGNYYTGGLVGQSMTNSSITNCYAMGEVNGTSYVGGLVGYNYNSTIRNCVAANNSVIASSTINRIVGYNYISTTTNNYALNTMKVCNSSGNVVIADGLNTGSGMGRPFDTLKTCAFYNTTANWYNNTVWNINLPSSIWSICDGKWLPFLRWQGIDCDSIFNIIAETSIGGTITPNGATVVNVGKNKTFTFTANFGYEVDQLLIDSVNIIDSIANGSYTFINVNNDHTIEVIFKLKQLEFCGGDGSIGTPYEICTAEQLAIFAIYVNAGKGNSTLNKYYRLMNNIDLSNYPNWNPIGDYNSIDTTTCFRGNFNGNSKEILNLSTTYATYRGLFGYILNATIENLGIVNCNIIGGYETGGLVAKSDYSSISNCYVTGNVNGTRPGGLIGYGTGNLISSCYVTANISGGQGTGGLIGSDNYSTITNCYTTGNVNGSSRAGGLVGNSYSSIISYCYATGSITGGDDQGTGGLVGLAYYGITIRNCVAANDKITSLSGIYTNRIIGQVNYGNLSNNYAINTMIVQNGIVTITDNLNGAAGMGKNIDTLQRLAFYATAGNWYNNTAWNINPPLGIWKICDGEDLPFLRWQRISCNDTFAIVATAGNNGIISPFGIVNVMNEDNKTFSFLADNCYEIDSLWIDGVYTPDSIAEEQYTFNYVTENHTIDVSFKPKTYFTVISDTTCFDVPYYFSEHNLKTSGVYYDTLQTVSGCDSIIELTLTVNPTYITFDTAIICQGENYLFCGKSYAATGIYRDTLQSIHGCDSIFELNLTVNPIYFTPIIESICQGNSYNFFGKSLTTAGIYQDTLQTIHGCDSIIELTLTVNSTYIISDTVIICQGEHYLFREQTYNSTGIYRDTLQTIHSCDSIFELNLTVNSTYFTPILASICEGGSYNLFGKVLTTTGIYYDTLQAIYGCDSIIELTLTVLPYYFTPITINICEENSYNFHGNLLNTAGIYYDTLQATHGGCDSIIELTLTVNPTYITQISESICVGDVYDFFGKSLTIAGIYQDTMQSIHSCDSIIELILAVNPLPEIPIINKNGNILTSSNADSYQWYFNNTLIAGATEQSYTCTQIGNYFVEITDELGCSSKSDEMNITEVSISEITEIGGIKVYPNPATTELYVQLFSQETAIYTIYSVIGQVIMHDKLPSEISTINIESLSKGIYYLKISGKENVLVKFIKN